MTRRLRVLFTISDLVGAGAEREMSNLLAYLPRDRFEPHLCLWRPVFDYPPPVDTPIHVVHKYRPWDILVAARRMVQVIDEIQPDLVFSQLPYVSVVAGLAVRISRWKPPWICRLAGNPYVDLRFPILPVARRVLKHADYVVGCSRGVTAALVAHLGIDPHRACTLLNMVDVESIRELTRQPASVTKTPNTFTIVHAGRFMRQKNQAMLLKAFHRFRGRAAELWMLGKGPLAEHLQQEAKRLKIDSQVRWLGFQQNPFAIFRQADCFALSSNHEGLPNVVVESLLAETPVLSTDCPFGPRELIENGKNGILVPVGDVLAFGEALEQMANPAIRLNLRRGIRPDMGEQFAMTVLGPKYAELFNEVANRVPVPATMQMAPECFL